MEDLKSGLEVRVGIHKVIQTVDYSSAADDILANDLTNVGPASDQAADYGRELSSRISQGSNSLEEKKR